MMGHREKMRGGDEYDMLCRRSRRYYRHRAGQASAAKRSFSRRQRRLGRRFTEEQLDALVELIRRP